MNSTDVQTLRQLARRLEDNSDFMASALAQYEKQERLDDHALAEQLVTTVDMLVRLALCKRPRSESSQFAEQVKQIAEYVKIDAAHLANLLRQVETAEQFLRRPDARQNPLGSGLLAAARDRDENETPEKNDDDVAG